MNYSKLGLFFVIFIIPLGLIYTVATGDNTYGGLPYFGQEVDGNKFKVGDFSFVDGNGDNVISKDFEGKIIITSFLVPACPSLCPIKFPFLKMMFIISS